MAESSGTFWSWLSARLVADCWHPDMFRPEYVELENSLTAASGFVPLRDFVEIVAPSAADSQPKKWHADSSGIRRHIVGRPEPDKSSFPIVALPHEAILVSSHWSNEPTIRYWNENVFRGRGTASGYLWVLESRSNQSIAWLCDALRRKESTLQLQRAVAGSPFPSLTQDALLDLRVRCLSDEQRSAVNRTIHDLAKSEMSELHLKALRKPFVLTGQTFEERMTQFEQFLLSEGICSRGDAFFVEPSTNSKGSDLFAVRPIRSDSVALHETDSFLPQDDAIVSSRWRSWFWDESATECHRIFNALAADDELPTHLLLRTGAVLFPSEFGWHKCLLPRFEAFRQAVLPSIHEDVGIEDQVWAQTWNDLQRSAGLPSCVTDAPQEENSASQVIHSRVSDHQLFDWARRVYRPVLALKVWRGEAIVGAYLLFGDDQTGDFAAAYSKLDDIGIALAEVLRPQSTLVEDSTRRESLRRLSWVMHQLNGPVGRANGALDDVNEFLADHPELGRMLVPNDEKARRRARMPGSAPLEGQTLAARLQDAMKAVADVRKIAYQVRRLRRVQGALPKSRFELAQLLADRAQSCRGQLPGLLVECTDFEDIVVDGNPESIREAIDEVLSNACRELRERDAVDPRIVLRCWIEQEMAWLSISDNALPATVPLISDPFEEDSSSYAASGRGTGLGLAIVRETFRSHGGACRLNENLTEDGRIPGVTFVASLSLSPSPPHKGET